LEAKTQTRPDFFTIAGFGTIKGMNINLSIASDLSRKASKICKDLGIQTDTIPDPRFGKVKMYPTQILERVFNEYQVVKTS